MDTTADGRTSTGVPGLDDVMFGGFHSGRPYLVRGTAGAGKTVLGFHFLETGAAAGEDVLLVSLEERERDLRSDAASLGIDLNGVDLLDLGPNPDQFTTAESYDVFPPDQADPEHIIDRLREALTDAAYDRLFLDPLSELRALFPNDYQFRREVASLVAHLKERGTTALFATELVQGERDDLQFVADGALLLERTPTGRTLEVTKFRGSDFRNGQHTLRIDGEGLHVFPRLVPAEHRRTFTTETVSSGVDELDALLGGGIERGTVTVIAGPAGVGKSTTGSPFGARRRDGASDRPSSSSRRQRRTSATARKPSVSPSARWSKRTTSTWRKSNRSP